jgi:hypothetical protein
VIGHEIGNWGRDDIEEFIQARPTDKKPEGNSFKRVVVVENRVDDELTLLIVNIDEEPRRGNLINEEELENTMATVELDCTIVTSNLGPGGTRWKSPPLRVGEAVLYISDHVEWDHGAPEGDVGGGEPVSCNCCKNGVKSIYHWNNCSVSGCRYLTDKKDGAECMEHKRAGEEAAGDPLVQV